MTKVYKNQIPKVLPSDISAEQALISCVLQKPKILREIIEIGIDDFYRSAHQSIFKSMLELQEDGEIIDLIILKDYLSKRNELEMAGGEDYLIELASMDAIPSAITGYAKIVKGKSFKRGVISECSRLIESAYQEHTDIESLHEDLLETLKNISPVTGKLSIEIIKWIEQQTGVFYLTEIYKDRPGLTKIDKSNISQICSRLVKQGKIERYGSKSGCFRKINDDSEVIDWYKDNGTPLDIRLPLGLERFIHIMPKNIICIAGSPDSGKTAVALNFVKLNQKRHKVWYFSSEMGPMELKSRLTQFEGIGIDEWNFEARERSDNFSDIIRPDDINVIDFLEISDNFYQIGQRLTDIYKRLRGGIAFIALQKDPKVKTGRGGMFSMEKPRLYLTVDGDYPYGQVIRILKAKNWRNPEINPNGYFCKFKILKGCNLQPGAWEVE